jgi:hypothetical protein
MQKCAFASMQSAARLSASSALALTYHDQLDEGIATVQHLARADLLPIMMFLC